MRLVHFCWYNLLTFIIWYKKPNNNFSILGPKSKNSISKSLVNKKNQPRTPGWHSRLSIRPMVSAQIERSQGPSSVRVYLTVSLPLPVPLPPDINLFKKAASNFSVILGYHSKSKVCSDKYCYANINEGNFIFQWLIYVMIAEIFSSNCSPFSCGKENEKEQTT